MDMPSMSVGGVTPTVSPLLVIFILVFVAGALMALLWRSRRMALLLQKGFNPFSPADFTRLMNSSIEQVLPGQTGFLAGRYGRISLALMLVGGFGAVAMLLVALFAR